MRLVKAACITGMLGLGRTAHVQSGVHISLAPAAGGADQFNATVRSSRCAIGRRDRGGHHWRHDYRRYHRLPAAVLVLGRLTRVYPAGTAAAYGMRRLESYDSC